MATPDTKLTKRRDSVRGGLIAEIHNNPNSNRAQTAPASNNRGRRLSFSDEMKPNGGRARDNAARGAQKGSSAHTGKTVALSGANGDTMAIRASYLKGKQ